MKPCPHCGERIHKTSSGWAHPRTKPDEPVCLYSGHHIGDAIIDRWEQRGPVVYYTVLDGWPIFNATGQGEPVPDIKTLQSFFNYLRDGGK